MTTVGRVAIDERTRIHHQLRKSALNESSELEPASKGLDQIIIEQGFDHRGKLLRGIEHCSGQRQVPPNPHFS